MRSAHALDGVLDMTPLAGFLGLALVLARQRMAGRLRDRADAMRFEHLPCDGVDLGLGCHLALPAVAVVAAATDGAVMLRPVLKTTEGAVSFHRWPAPVPGSTAVSGPNLSIPSPCFGQTLLALWAPAGIVEGAKIPARPDAGDIAAGRDAMHSTLKRQQADPHGVHATEPNFDFDAQADEASPDPVHEVLSLLSKRRAQAASEVPVADVTPTVDTTFRATAVDGVKVAGPRSAVGRWARNAIVAFLFALCSVFATTAWKHHGDTARQMIASWMPPFVVAAFAPSETPPLAAQPDGAPVLAAGADQTPVQPATAAGAAATGSPSDSAPLLASMARDVAAMGQQIEQLKASIEQFKASQAEMSRNIARNAEAKLPEPSPQPHVAALPPRPAPPPRKPKPAVAPAATASTYPPPAQYYPAPPPPAFSQPAPPPQATADQDGQPVVRPPMPLH
jgi:hypothetical protein